MNNIVLILEYDGTGFAGWQRQPEQRTVQGVVEAAAGTVFGQEVDVIGAGRTDAGVHALGYVANFLVDTNMDEERLEPALGANLPEDVVVRAARYATPDFHARFDALSRRYRYRIATAATAVNRRYTALSRFQLDPGTMARAAEALLGEHDFTSFTPALNDAHPVCRVFDIDVRTAEGEIVIEVEANRFLHNMVRIIAGTLMDVGRGRFGREQMGDILGKKDRRAAGPTAPPQGLFFVTATYPEGRP